MTAFARAALALHADRNMSLLATYTPEASRALPSAFVRVILSTPLEDAPAGVGGRSALVRPREASLPAAALAYEPRRGDTLLIGPTNYRVENARQDDEATAWFLTLGL